MPLILRSGGEALDLASKQESTMVSSSADGAEEINTPKEKAAEKTPPMEYPAGLEAFFILLALILTIILWSLDQVSASPSSTATPIR